MSIYWKFNKVLIYLKTTNFQLYFCNCGIFYWSKMMRVKSGGCFEYLLCALSVGSICERLGEHWIPSFSWLLFELASRSLFFSLFQESAQYLGRVISWLVRLVYWCCALVWVSVLLDISRLIHTRIPCAFDNQGIRNPLTPTLHPRQLPSLSWRSVDPDQRGTLRLFQF